MAPGSAGWDDLPRVVRHEILGWIYAECDSEHRLKRIFDIAKCAAVCRDWQLFFERRTFHTLTIDASPDDSMRKRFQGFQDAMRSRFGNERLNYISHLKLRVEVPVFAHYDQAIFLDEATDCHSFADILFLKALRSLFDILAVWKPQDDHKGMTLELSLHPFHELTRNEPFNDQDNYICSIPQSAITTTDLRQFELFRRVCAEPCWGHVLIYDGMAQEGVRVRRRLESFPYWMIDLPRVLSRVPIVTTFRMRRQWHRQPSPSALGVIIGFSLVGVKSIIIDRWCMPTTNHEATYMSEVSRRLLPRLPNRLQKLQLTSTIFPGNYTAENLVNNHRYYLALAQCPILTLGPRVTDLIWSQPVYVSCNPPTDLEPPGALEHHLRRVSIRFSRCIWPGCSIISELLELFAETCARLPTLQHVQVWDRELRYPWDTGAAITHFFVFNFKDQQHLREIKWRSSLPWAPDRRVVEAWARVARIRGYRPLEVDSKHCEPEDLEIHGICDGFIEEPPQQITNSM